ncbi:MAG: purine-binding chemotaxis protein CheW [SAR324 cluster bacterium]|nr:purine-binding chemotaxis protein CheW [SAR324 cluster bacterium]
MNNNQVNGATEDEDAMSGMYLTFTLAEQTYGIAIRYVLEIIGIQKVTDVPDVEPYIKGVINLRGQVIPVMDVRLRFNMLEREYDDRTCIIVVQLKDAFVGLIVDRVSEVMNIPDSLIQPPPSTNHPSTQKFMEGLGKIQEKVIVLMNIERVVERQPSTH